MINIIIKYEMRLSSAIAHVIITTTATTIAIMINFIKYEMRLSSAIAHVIIITTATTFTIINNIIIKYETCLLCLQPLLCR